MPFLSPGSGFPQQDLTLEHHQLVNANGEQIAIVTPSSRLLQESEEWYNNNKGPLCLPPYYCLFETTGDEHQKAHEEGHVTRHNQLNTVATNGYTLEDYYDWVQMTPQLPHVPHASHASNAVVANHAPCPTPVCYLMLKKEAEEREKNKDRNENREEALLRGHLLSRSPPPPALTPFTSSSSPSPFFFKPKTRRKRRRSKSQPSPVDREKGEGEEEEEEDNEQEVVYSSLHHHFDFDVPRRPPLPLEFYSNGEGRNGADTEVKQIQHHHQKLSKISPSPSLSSPRPPRLVFRSKSLPPPSSSEAATFSTLKRMSSSSRGQLTLSPPPPFFTPDNPFFPEPATPPTPETRPKSEERWFGDQLTSEDLTLLLIKLRRSHAHLAQVGETLKVQMEGEQRLAEISEGEDVEGAGVSANGEIRCGRRKGRSPHWLKWNDLRLQLRENERDWRKSHYFVSFLEGLLVKRSKVDQEKKLEREKQKAEKQATIQSELSKVDAKIKKLLVKRSSLLLMRKRSEEDLSSIDGGPGQEGEADIVCGLNGFTLEADPLNKIIPADKGQRRSARGGVDGEGEATSGGGGKDEATKNDDDDLSQRMRKLIYNSSRVSFSSPSPSFPSGLRGDSVTPTSSSPRHRLFQLNSTLAQELLLLSHQKGAQGEFPKRQLSNDQPSSIAKGCPEGDSRREGKSAEGEGEEGEATDRRIEGVGQEEDEDEEDGDGDGEGNADGDGDRDGEGRLSVCSSPPQSSSSFSFSDNDIEDVPLSSFAPNANNRKAGSDERRPPSPSTSSSSSPPMSPPTQKTPPIPPFTSPSTSPYFLPQETSHDVPRKPSLSSRLKRSSSPSSASRGCQFKEGSRVIGRFHVSKAKTCSSLNTAATGSRRCGRQRVSFCSSSSQ